MKKRDFLKTFGTAAIGAPFLSFDSNLNYNHVDYSDRKNLSEKEFWKKTKEGLKSLGMSAKIVSTGGTPNFQNIGQLDGATEHRAGTCIFNDLMMIKAGVAKFEDCALQVFTSVVSQGAVDRGILDAGSKTLTSDQSKTMLS